MQQPLSEEIKKNSIVALYAYAGEDEDNHGLPFFLRKVINVIDNSKTDGDADEGKDESDKASKYLVKIHEYIDIDIQTENYAGEPTGKFQLHNEHGEREKTVRKPRNPRRSITSFADCRICR